MTTHPHQCVYAVLPYTAAIQHDFSTAGSTAQSTVTASYAMVCMAIWRPGWPTVTPCRHSPIRDISMTIGKLNQPSTAWLDHAQPPCRRPPLYSELYSKKLLYKAIQRRRPAHRNRSAVEQYSVSTALYCIQLYSALHSTALYNPPQAATGSPRT